MRGIPYAAGFRFERLLRLISEGRPGQSLVKTRAALKSRTYALLAPLELGGDESQTMLRALIFLVTLGDRVVRAMCRRRADLVMENLVLQQQVAELNKQRPRPTLDDTDRAPDYDPTDQVLAA